MELKEKEQIIIQLEYQNNSSVFPQYHVYHYDSDHKLKYQYQTDLIQEVFPNQSLLTFGFHRLLNHGFILCLEKRRNQYYLNSYLQAKDDFVSVFDKPVKAPSLAQLDYEGGMKYAWLLDHFGNRSCHASFESFLQDMKEELKRGKEKTLKISLK